MNTHPYIGQHIQFNTYTTVTLLWHTLVILAYAVLLQDQGPYNVTGSPCMDSAPIKPQRTPK